MQPSSMVSARLFPEGQVSIQRRLFVRGLTLHRSARLLKDSLKEGHNRVRLNNHNTIQRSLNHLQHPWAKIFLQQYPQLILSIHTNQIATTTLYTHKTMFCVCSAQLPQVGMCKLMSNKAGYQKQENNKKNRAQTNEANIKLPKPRFMFQSTGLDVGEWNQTDIKWKSKHGCRHLRGKLKQGQTNLQQKPIKRGIWTCYNTTKQT